MTPEERVGTIANRYWYEIFSGCGVEIFNSLKMDIADAISLAVAEEREACAAAAYDWVVRSLDQNTYIAGVLRDEILERGESQ